MTELEMNVETQTETDELAGELSDEALDRDGEQGGFSLSTATPCR